MSLNIVLIILTTTATILTLWWDYFIKEGKKSFIKELTSTILIIIIVVLTYNQSQNDKAMAASEREKDSLRYQQQYDSLITNIIVARKTAEIAEKAYTYLRWSNESEAKKRTNDYEYALKDAFSLIMRRYENILYPSNDETAYLKNVNVAISDISDIVSSVKSNPILTSNPIIYRYYNGLDSSLADLRLLSSGYGLESVQKLREAFDKKVGKFCHFITLYSDYMAGSFKYHPLTKIDSIKIQYIVTDNSMKFDW